MVRLNAYAAAPEGRVRLFHVSPTHDTITPFQTKRVADYEENLCQWNFNLLCSLGQAISSTEHYTIDVATRLKPLSMVRI